GGLRGGRRLVRDPRAGREVARWPLPARPRRARVASSRAVGTCCRGHALRGMSSLKNQLRFPAGRDMSQGPISYKPTAGLSYDPSEPVYWDRPALAQEVTRAFEICHGCRMCFKYCDAFPSLFELIDKRHDGDVTKITPAETAGVMDACFQCKLCEVQCPYTPRDGHEFQLDFPKLV